jgi:membrane protein
MFCWVFGSALLRIVLVGTASGSTSIYGPLAAPIAVLLWLYLLSIAVLIGAALNAAFDQIWPQKELTHARLERLKRLKLENVLPWRNSLEGVAEEKDRSAKANDPAEGDATASGTSPS